MIRYRDKPETRLETLTTGGYRQGVDRMLEYIESINAYPKLVSELKWAIEEKII